MIAERNGQISAPTTISHVRRPLPPKEITVEADFDKARFRIVVTLASATESKSEGCSIRISSSESTDETIEISVKRTNESETRYAFGMSKIKSSIRFCLVVTRIRA